MKIWIFIDGSQQGPFTLEELADKQITPDTKVWFAGLPKWYPAGTLDELKPLFDGSLASARQQEQDNAVQDNDTYAPTVQIPAPTHPAEAQTADEPQSAVETGTDVESGTDDDHYEPAPTEPLPQNPVQVPQFRVPEFNNAPAFQPVPAQPVEPCPPTYIVWSVLLVVLCCSPFAIAALIGSIMVSTKYNRENLAGARRASEFTAWMIMISIALGMLPSLLMTALL